MSEAPFTAAQARALTDTHSAENGLVRDLRLTLLPAIRAFADRGKSMGRFEAFDHLRAAAVKSHLEGLGYTVVIVPLGPSMGDPVDVEVSW